MASFTKLFKITPASIIDAGKYDLKTGKKGDASKYDNKAANRILELITEGSLDGVFGNDVDVKNLRDNLQKEGIVTDGLAIGGRGLSIVSLIAPAKNSPDNPKVVPNAIGRIEYMDPPLDHPIVLRHAYYKDDPSGFKFYVLPNAPDTLNPDNPSEQFPTNEDILRTIRVLKATGRDESHPNGYAKKLWDFERDNFVFLPDPNNPGDILRYPKGEKFGDFSNKPIAFVRDLNACGAREQNSITTWSPVEQAGGLDKLETAPKECVEACKAQYKITMQLIENLKEAGIESNIMPPVGKWALDTTSKRLSIPVMKL